LLLSSILLTHVGKPRLFEVEQRQVSTLASLAIGLYTSFMLAESGKHISSNWKLR